MVCEMASRLARCTPDREAWFLALDWVILLRTWVQHFTLTALSQLFVVLFSHLYVRVMECYCTHLNEVKTS